MEVQSVKKCTSYILICKLPQDKTGMAIRLEIISSFSHIDIVLNMNNEGSTVSLTVRKFRKATPTFSYPKLNNSLKTIHELGDTHNTKDGDAGRVPRKEF